MHMHGGGGGVWAGVGWVGGWGDACQKHSLRCLTLVLDCVTLQEPRKKTAEELHYESWGKALTPLQ